MAEDFTETQQGIAEGFAALGESLATYNRGDEAFSIMTVTTSCPGKGPHVLISAFPATEQDHADALREVVIKALLAYGGKE